MGTILDILRTVPLLGVGVNSGEYKNWLIGPLDQYFDHALRVASVGSLWYCFWWTHVLVSILPIYYTWGQLLFIELYQQCELVYFKQLSKQLFPNEFPNKFSNLLWN